MQNGGFGKNLISTFAQNYESSYPLHQPDSWATRLLTGLLVFLRNNDHNFGKSYLPFLGNDPLSTLENILNVY